MKSVSSHDIRTQLLQANHAELVEYCLRLIRFKKENKELLTFVLFDADDPSGFTQRVKDEIDTSFGEMNITSVYFVKKSLRKIIRYLNKYSRIAGSKLVEAELFAEFCMQLKKLPPSVSGHKQIAKIHDTLRVKIESAISSLHPDLQYDVRKQLENV